MSIVYGLLTWVAVCCLVEAVRPTYTSSDAEAISFGGSIVGGLCCGVIVFLALAVGT